MKLSTWDRVTPCRTFQGGNPLASCIGDVRSTDKPRQGHRCRLQSTCGSDFNLTPPTRIRSVGRRVLRQSKIRRTIAARRIRLLKSLPTSSAHHRVCYQRTTRVAHYRRRGAVRRMEVLTGRTMCPLRGAIFARFSPASIRPPPPNPYSPSHPPQSTNNLRPVARNRRATIARFVRLDTTSCSWIRRTPGGREAQNAHHSAKFTAIALVTVATNGADWENARCTRYGAGRRFYKLRLNLAIFPSSATHVDTSRRWQWLPNQAIGM